MGETSDVVGQREAQGRDEADGSWVLGGNGNVCANLPAFGWKCAGGIAGIGDEGVAGCLLMDYIAGGMFVKWNSSFGFFKDCWWT